MGRLIVYEMVDERVPKFGDVYLSYGGHPLVSSCNDDPEDKERTILRRLTDEEVEQRLVAATRTIAVDSDRARFIRDTAVRLLPALIVATYRGPEQIPALMDDALATAESLAAKVFP